MNYNIFENLRNQAPKIQWYRACSVPSHYMTNDVILSIRFLRKKEYRRNLTQNKIIFFQVKGFENITSEKAAISSRA